MFLKIYFLNIFVTDYVNIYLDTPMSLKRYHLQTVKFKKLKAFGNHTVGSEAMAMQYKAEEWQKDPFRKGFEFSHGLSATIGLLQ